VNIVDWRGGRVLLGRGTINGKHKMADRGQYTSYTMDGELNELSFYDCMDNQKMSYPRYNGLFEFLAGAYNPLTGNRNTDAGYYGLLPVDWNVVPVGFGSVGSNWKAFEQVGLGDSQYSALEPCLYNVGEECGLYGNIWYRDSTYKRGVGKNLEIGPMHNWSGVTIWGGTPLGILVSRSGYHIYDPTQPNAAFAQLMGLSVIAGVQYENTTDGMANIIWAPAAGDKSTGFHSLSQFWSGSPSDGSYPRDSTHAGNTWWQPDNPSPGGSPNPHYTTYYLYGNPDKSSYDRKGFAHWQGKVFRLIARERNDGTWEYGVVDWTDAQQYGPKEQVLPTSAKQDFDAFRLLSRALGQLVQANVPTQTWVFTVFHPRVDPGMCPPQVQPGDQINVHYEGQVNAVYLITDPTSEFFGQYQPLPTGPVTWAKFPLPPYDLNDGVQFLLSRCAQVEEVFDATGHTSTYTMGHGKITRDKRLKHWADKLAARMESAYAGLPENHQTVASGKFQGVPIVLSQSPTAQQHSDKSGNYLTLDAAGAYAITIVQKEGALTNGARRVTFELDTVGDDYCVDFLFGVAMGDVSAIPAGGILSGWTGSGGIFRFQGPKAPQNVFGHKNAFYIFVPTYSLTFKGTTRNFKLYPAGKYAMTIEWQQRNNKFSGFASAPGAAQSYPLIADYGNPPGTLFSGNIGWFYRNGTGSLTIRNIDMSN
jgi:hypothetical protein